MRTLVLLALMAAVPSPGLAQAALAGSVKDQSGNPLANVTVTAASPAIIEKARVGVTDDRGRYRIDDLHPGRYDVSFTLKGWRPYQREDVELTGSSTVIVNVELMVGTVTEAVTVTANCQCSTPTA